MMMMRKMNDGDGSETERGSFRRRNFRFLPTFFFKNHRGTVEFFGMLHLLHGVRAGGATKVAFNIVRNRLFLDAIYSLHIRVNVCPVICLENHNFPPGRPRRRKFYFRE